MTGDFQNFKLLYGSMGIPTDELYAGYKGWLQGMEWGGTGHRLFQRFRHCLQEPTVKILLLIVRTPGCEPDAFRIQVTGVDTVLI